MKKNITVFQTSPDSIDVEDKIQIEVWYKESRTVISSNYNEQNIYVPEEITSIEYEGIEVSHLICTMFTDDEILNAQSDLETDKDLSEIRKINLIEQ